MKRFGWHDHSAFKPIVQPVEADPMRTRKLLLARRQIDHLAGSWNPKVIQSFP